MESFEQARQFVRGNADARVADADFGRLRVCGQCGPHDDPSRQREFERIGDQVQDPPSPTSRGRAGPAGSAARSRRRTRGPRARGSNGTARRVRRSARRCRSARCAGRRGRLDPREVEQGIDELSSRRPLRCVISTSVREPSASSAGFASSSSSGPSISVSGVRNSWLMFEKNVVFARSSSASASARCRSCS